MKIETKIATNGVKLYYVDGKRTSREVALQAAADSRENLFTIEYATRHIAYFTGRILDATQVYESTSKAVLKELELKIDEYHGFTVQLHTIGWVEICKLFNKDYAKSLINKIENAFIRGEYGVKIDTYGKVSILPAPVVEPNPDDYAINPDALEVAVNAEIKNANNEAPKFKYYLQSRRPIAGAVPNGYISATQGEMKAYSLRSDGSISPVPRKVVFGVVVYDHPLSDQQIINYDLHVDPLNPKVEPDTTPQVDHITGIKEENVMTIKAQANFLADKIKREVKALDDYTTDRDAVFNLLPDLDELNDVDTTPDKNNVDTLTAVIAKYQAAFDAAQKASIADDMKFLDINKDTLMFSYGKLTAVISDRYNSEIRISGRKYFRYRGMIEKRADFLDHMNNEVIAADQRATFDEFKEDYQLETDGDYFKISIFPRFANGTGSYFHATANDFNCALELVELFKTLDLPFDGTIKCNEISGKEYYHHNRDGSEVINPPELKLPANIKDSLQRAMKIALEAYRLYNLKHNQKAANRERECFMICKKALKEVA